MGLEELGEQLCLFVQASAVIEPLLLLLSQLLLLPGRPQLAVHRWCLASKPQSRSDHQLALAAYPAVSAAGVTVVAVYAAVCTDGCAVHMAVLQILLCC